MSRLNQLELRIHGGAARGRNCHSNVGAGTKRRRVDGNLHAVDLHDGAVSGDRREHDMDDNERQHDPLENAK